MSLRHQSLESSGFLPQAVEELLRTWSYRCAGSGLCGLALLIWLCLLTWTGESSGDLAATPNNAFGPIGSIVADLLFQGLGLASVFALLPLVFFGVELFRHERVALLSARLVFWPLSVALIAGGLSAVPTVQAWPLQHGFGGLTGDFLFGFSRQILDTFEPSLGGIIASTLLWVGGFSLLCRALNIQPRDLLVLLEFSPRHGALEEADRETVPSLGDVSERRGFFRNLFRKRSHAPANHQGSIHTPYMSDHAYPDTPAGYEAGPLSAQPPFYAHTQPQGPSMSVHTDPQHGMPGTHGGADAEAASERALYPTEEIDGRAIAARFAPDGVNSQAPLSHAPEAHLVEDAVFAGDARAADENIQPTHRQAGSFRLPSLKLLARGRGNKSGSEFEQNVLRGNARLLEDVLADFGVKGEIVGVHPGPVVTLYELEPARGIKAARVIGLADDIARSMSAVSARVAVVPGKNAIGIELPNTKRDPVLLRDLLEDKAFAHSEATLPLAIGKAIDGSPIVTDLARMPHLLVAGTTGSGKSVGVNAMILSLLYRYGPDECRFIMIDPKMLELSVYNGIPHLLSPVVTDPRKAVLALNWAVREMEERYKRMSELGVRNMAVYNARLADAARQNAPIQRTVQTGFDRESGEPVYENRVIDHTPMPCIVIVIDEMADLMMTAGKEIEATVQRLAQMARAAGIHLITATQRPSVDVITGTIKANLPTRISFKVTTATDSRTILGQQGAEQLLGAGDMLFAQGGGQLARVHGPFVSEDEVEAVVTHLTRQGDAQYVPEITEEPESAPAQVGNSPAGSGGNGPNELYDKAVAIVLRDGKPSISYVQRRLSIGYNRAADLIDRMEADGIVSPAGPTGRREILLEHT